MLDGRASRGLVVEGSWARIKGCGLGVDEWGKPLAVLGVE
jgi:hypothetical protein